MVGPFVPSIALPVGCAETTWAKHVYPWPGADFKASPLRPLKVGNDSNLDVFHFLQTLSNVD